MFRLWFIAPAGASNELRNLYCYSESTRAILARIMMRQHYRYIAFERGE